VWDKKAKAQGVFAKFLIQMLFQNLGEKNGWIKLENDKKCTTFPIAQPQIFA